MTEQPEAGVALLRQRLAELEATLNALLSGEIDAVIDPRDNSPVLLAIAQKQLRESEERYRSIVETASEGIWLLALDGTVTFANERMAELLGCTVSDIVGHPLYRFVPVRQHALVVQRLARAPLGVPEESESALRLPDGRELVVVVRSSTIRDAGGECVGLLVMITDASRRSDAERALRESEAQYRQIVESTTDGVIKLDPGGTIVFVNARLSEILGYSPGELVGADVLSIVMPSEHGAVRGALAARSQGATAPTDTVYRHKNGSSIPVNIAGAALHDEGGSFVGILGIVRDVTEHRRMQSELIVSDRMASVGTLAAGVAHEINNPLAAVISNLDCLREGIARLQSGDPQPIDPAWLQATFSEPLADAQEATERVRRIVKDLMILSRSPGVERRVSVNVNAVLESSLRMARNEIRHRAELVKDLGVIPDVVADDARLGQVFLNLIVNAAQSMPVGRAAQHRLHVSTRQVRDTVVVAITDSGTGIAPSDLGRIFDAFYTTKDVGEGTGLGLAICQRIVSNFGGALKVHSELGVGSTFSVSLPVATAPGTDRAPTVTKVLTPYSGRVLVIDDEDIVARSVHRSLGASCDFTHCNSAGAALALFQGGRVFDVVLCDIMMPNVTGIDLYRELLSIAPAQAHRMMFMTGGAFTPEARRFVADADVVLLEKPFGVAELRAAVHRFSESRERQRT